MKIVYVIVAFKHTQKHSILYRDTPNASAIGAWAIEALTKDADVISIRKIQVNE